MNKQTILEQLAQKHPACLGIHSDIKDLTPAEALQALLDNGYTDVSYGNDECPSYFKVKTADDGEVYERYIYLYDDVDEDYKRISDVIKFKVRDESEIYPSEEVGVFDTIEEAIERA